jgi:hypothetical protein
MAVDYSGGYTSGGAQAECVFGARVGYDEDSCKQEMEQVLVGRRRRGLEDIDMRARQVILDRLEWSVTLGGRFVSGSAPGDAGRSDAIKVCLCWHHSLSLLAYTMISRQWCGPKCVKSFHEMHNFLNFWMFILSLGCHQ